MAESHESVRKFIEKMQTVLDKKCGCSLMVELQPSKLTVRVRFSSPAPNSQLTSFGVFFFFYLSRIKGKATTGGYHRWKMKRTEESQG